MTTKYRPVHSGTHAWWANLSPMTPMEIPEPPAPPDLRPLGVGEILDAAFRLLRQNLGAYLKVALWLLTIPAVLTGAYMLSQVVAIRNGFLLVEDPSAYNNAVLGLGLINRLLQLFCFGVLVHLSTRLYMNHVETVGSIIKRSGRRFAPFVGQTILLVLYGFAVIVVSSAVASPFGLIGAFLVLGIVLAWLTFYSLSAPAFWYEELGAAKAIGRSATLVRKRFWPVLGSLAVGFILVVVFSVGLGVLMVTTFLQVEQPIPYVLVTIGAEYLGNLISLLIIAPIVTVVYFDGRVRTEGFDMELKLGVAKKQQPPPPVPW